MALVEDRDPNYVYQEFFNYVRQQTGRKYYLWLDSDPVALGDWLLQRAEIERAAGR